MKGAEACGSLRDAMAIVEFAAMFGKQTGLEPLSLGILQAAVAWPLDSPDLAELYMALLRSILQDQARALDF